MKALVTGGAGFIGSNLVKLLVSEGHIVRVLDNLCSGHRINLTPFPEAQIMIGDIRDPSVVDLAVKGMEVVFHLASSVGNMRSIEHPIVDAETNVIGTLNILEAARRHESRKVIFSSSAGIFGELRTLPISEAHFVEPDSPYGATKLCAEKLCLAYAKIHHMEAICLRYFNVYGINQRYDFYGNVIPIFAHKIISNQEITIFGDGEQTRDFINVRDVVKANYLAGLNHGVNGAFNLGSGSSISINELANTLEDVSGVFIKKTYGPARHGDVRHSVADISAICSTLGFKPQVSLNNGLREYMDWVKTNHNKHN